MRASGREGGTRDQLGVKAWVQSMREQRTFVCSRIELEEVETNCIENVIENAREALEQFGTHTPAL